VIAFDYEIMKQIYEEPLNIKEFIKDLRDIFISECLLDESICIEVEGLNYYVNSSGFGAKKKGDDRIIFSVVVSGNKAKINYNELIDNKDLTIHEPENPGILFPKIKDIFEKLHFKVFNIEVSSYQTLNDQIGYRVLTNWPFYLVP